MKKERRPTEAGKALMRRFTALLLGGWLLTMGLITYAVAKDFYYQLYNEYETLSRSGFGISSQDYDPGLSGMAETGLIRTTGFYNYFTKASKLFPFQIDTFPESIGNNSWQYGKWDLLYGYEAAILYYNKEENFYLGSGNYLVFSYSLSKNMTADNSRGDGFGYIDLDAWDGCLEIMDPYISKFTSGDPTMELFLKEVHLTGYFDGAEFIPLSIDLGSYYDHSIDANVQRIWNNNLTRADIPENSEQVTVYARELFGIRNDYEPVTVNGTTFERLPELLQAQVNGEGDFRRESLWDTVFIHYGYNKFHVNNELVGEYPFAIAVRCWPMGYAALRLLPTYTVTLAAAFVLLRLLRRRITRSLLNPMDRALSDINRFLPIEPWEEPRMLIERIQKNKEALQDVNTENQQLRTALDYAKDAEEKRRRLVSDLTHELKTPLAIIHGYAEGLKSGIAEEKKERYLDIILEESERMDGMVLQMLDLSRLEAGKVRLSNDTFSLTGLVKRTVEKFAPAMEEKEVRLHFLRMDEFDITADESRMTQVVTNLVSNAVKYVTPGGNIRLWVYKFQGGIRFEIENTAPPLPDEALEKVFDSFYRSDPSRTEPGTGLGLAIVKGIVQLHGGKCIVRNKKYTDETCVEFSVALPVD